MKRGLSTLILLVAAAALGAYIYFVESKRKPSSELVQKSKVFADLDGAKVEQLEVKSSGSVTALKKENGTWQIVTPVTARAEESEISAITTNLASMEVERVVAEQPKDLSQFGLAPPKIEVLFRTDAKSPEHRLLIGEKSATGSELFAKLGNEARVFLLSASLETTLARTTFDLREKRVLHFDRDKLTSFEVVSPDHNLSLAKDGNDWKIVQPIAAKAEFSTVESMVSQVGSGQMKSIVEESASDLAKYGLDKPTRSVAFQEGSARSALLFGNKSPDGQVYAKDAARPLVFTVEARLLDELSKPLDDLRPKDIYEFRTFTGNRFEITRDGKTLVFEKQKGKDATAPDVWAQTQPKPEKPIDSSKIEDYLSKVSTLRAQSFVMVLPPGAAQQAQTTARFSDDKKQETTTFYKTGSDIYAVRGTDPGAGKLGASDWDEALKALDAVK